MQDISHLQFADDVILFVNNDDCSVLGVKRTLQCFQVLSGMKINFDKSHIFGFHASTAQINRWASTLGCRHGSLPLSYLGASIGSSPSAIKFWDPLINCIRKKLSEYDTSHISMAGRIILLKSVIDSTPIYWLSLYKLPVTTTRFWQIRREIFDFVCAVDAAWKLNKGGIGGFIRNRTGKVIYNFSGPSTSATCVLEAEIEAIVHRHGSSPSQS
ncbi:hypothetical protein DCAR_0416035 [Daucus carota subsp. sativus]|uniref:Reverse transcriptase domain-containing protein n=1 Tax=Daucus carota subsp. sativus TaxID=79200 RepID=A0AAF0WWA0_DAUCS|nr:hypothetical protein DCAR_0416035 [Daucus carota subsp. sativus]